MDIKHVLHCNPTDPVYASRAQAARAALPERFLDIAGGNIEIGHRGTGFAFDNEGPRHVVLPRAVRHRQPSRNCAANGSSSSPTTATSGPSSGSPTAGTPCRPTSGTPRSTGATTATTWTVFTLNGRRPVDPNEPVIHVSHYEADAYARWRGTRLPTEFEWEHAATSTHADDVARTRRRRVAVDGQRLSAVPALPARRRCGR